MRRCENNIREAGKEGEKKKIGIKGANTGASHDRLSTSPAACG